MANKKYISLIRLFNHVGIDANEEINISRIKKVLNAEFAMAQDGFITIDGFTYNKQDVVEELDNSNFEERLFYHKKICNSPFLLALLETYQGNFVEVKSELNNLQHDEKFDAFFSPYFAEPFNYSIKQRLDEGQLQAAGNWLIFEPFILHEDREAAFKSTRVFLDDSERLFNNITAENFRVFETQLRPWLNHGWSQFLNNLPDELFQYREILAVDLINLTVTFQKKYLHYSKLISDDLVQVKGLSPNLRETILNNDNVFNGVGAKKETNYWWILWVAFILIRAITSGGCN